MAENIASVVDWFGPYTGGNLRELLKSARGAARKDFDNGLYAAIGHGLEVRRGPRTMLYMGVGDPLHSRLIPQHHVFRQISITGLWLGEIAVAGIPGRRTKKINPHLDLVEWASIFFLKLPHNNRKKVAPPASCVVVNRWWGLDYETEAERPAARWADVIEYNAERKTANLVWFGKKGRVKAVSF